jgi:hypothetical protein
MAAGRPGGHRGGTGSRIGPRHGAAPSSHSGNAAPASGGGIKHVLLISVDGLHQQDLTWYVKNHPGSVLANLVGHGIEYSGALTPFPSDSFPGLIGQVTGGNPGTTGIYYDDTVQAVLNEINGFDHSGTDHVGVPAIFGINFQTVSTAEKLPTSDGLTGGYLPGGTVPGPLLVRALNYINHEIGAMVTEIRADGLAGSTAIIISAKHGQSPTDPNDLARVDDGPIINGIDAAWFASHPDNPNLVIFATDDDGMLLWLSDRSQAAADFVKAYLLTHSAAGNNIAGSPVTVSSSGLKTVYAGASAAALFRVPASDPRHPDIVGIVQHGAVYTGGKGKIAEHGGADFQDRNVPILVVLPGLVNGRTIGAPVETTQIAPTILMLLGLSPRDLQAVRIEHTPVLPGVGNPQG